MSSVETPEYLGMVRRMIRAAGRRCADADEVDLGDLAALRDDLDRALVVAVAGQRARGQSWAYIGRGLGITRQSAQERFAGCDAQHAG